MKAAFSLLLKASLVYSTLLWACVMLFPQAFAALFTSSAGLLEFTQSACAFTWPACCCLGFRLPAR